MGRDHLYIIQMAVTGDFKVGRSNDVKRRLGELQTGCPHRLRVILIAEGLGDREKGVHRALRRYRTRYGKGEWFHEEGIGSIPVDLWDMVDLDLLEDPDWWKSGRSQTLGAKIVLQYHSTTTRLDDRERREAPAEDRQYHQNDYDQAPTILAVGRTGAAPPTEIGPDPFERVRDVPKSAVGVVDLGEGVPARDRVVTCPTMLRAGKASPGVNRDREPRPEDGEDDDQVSEVRERREGRLVEDVAHDLFAFLGLDEPGEGRDRAE
jgi:hypothetical protein